MDLNTKKFQHSLSTEVTGADQQQTTEPLATAAAPARHTQETVSLEQWIEVTIENGVTKTTYYPSNEELREEGAAMDPPYNIVYRRFHWVNGVPPEYYHVTSDPVRRRNGGASIERMTPETWHRTTKEEEKDPNRHCLPVPFLARPADRGLCHCNVCTWHRENDAKNAA